MTTPITTTSQAIALDLHSLLWDIDPARWRDEMEASFRLRLQALQERVAAALERFQADSAIARRLGELREVMRSYELSPTGERMQGQWEQLRARLQPAYESLAAALRTEAVHVPNLRPTNYSRNVLHVGTSLFSLLILLAMPTQLSLILVAGAFSATCWTLEISRRRSQRVNDFLMANLQRFAHPHETYRVNSATWYGTALFLLSLTGSLPVCVAGVMVLGVGDPAAALIGRRFGRIKLVNGRSLEGTLSFVLFGTLAAFITMSLVSPAGALTFRAAAAAGFAGAIAELFSKRVDDNFSVPLAGALAAWIVLIG